MAMYIEAVPNRNSPPCILMRESYRNRGKVCHRTIANLTKWPPELVEGLRALLKGGTVVEDCEGGFDITRSLPHGHVAAVLGSIRKVRLDYVIASKPSRERDLVVAMIASRIFSPASKLATARNINAVTAASSLGLELGLADVDEDEFYGAMDWLLKRQDAIERKLAKRHLVDGTMILYDVSSSYYTGTHCALARFGHSRDRKKGFPQIVYGLLCNAEGCPVAIEVFAGNTADPTTLRNQIQKVRGRFGLERVVLVGDRGMITTARIDEELRDVDGLDWITALRAPAIRKLAEEKLLQPSLFDDRDLLEISSPDYPNERLVVCRNPFLAEERARKRVELLAATEQKLDEIVAAARRAKRPLKGMDKIGIRVGKILDRHKMGKHFNLTITSRRFSYTRDEEKIAAEAALDGLYVIRTSVAAEKMTAEGAVRAYKSLAQVERAFRCLKTIDLQIRPIRHRLSKRVRAHAFMCMLAYYVEWHMRQHLAPILFDDDDKETAEALRESVVAPAEPSPKAQRKAATKSTDDGEPVHSFATLLKDLATIGKNRITPRLPGAPSFWKTTLPTRTQARALELLGIRM